jgi:hypothetical protein
MREAAKSHSSSMRKFNPPPALYFVVVFFSKRKRPVWVFLHEREKEGNHLEIHLLVEHNY